ncbi:calmodulin-lysine N-methyltransferase-like [Lineus longissimus]|uniref:calmodulin-lysine N-methyltransferase-like n=1 Tax=Lineus longissimus TaxID=88925 RepID=UPI00315C593F
MAESANFRGVKKPQNRSATARLRWKMLGKALAEQKIDDRRTAVSVRRFLSFDLLSTKVIPNTDAANETSHPEQDEEYLWFHFTCKQCQQFEADICQLTGTLKLGDFLGFNNTGNVCIWPSEEVLTYYCLGDPAKFKKKNVCELGGGMTCLAGVAVAVGTEANEVILTDGNEKSIRNIQRIVDRNQSKFDQTEVKTCSLRWDEKYSAYEDHFDIVICADCLFFDDFREDLAKTIHSILKAEGEAIIFAPARGSTFQKFVDLASGLFKIEKVEQYDDVIWEKHLQLLKTSEDVYDPDIHYPVMLKMSKP